jgi:hypothetical protein
MNTSLIAAEMGVELGFNSSASNVFRLIADAVPAYEGLRYPAVKDESNPVQAKYDISTERDRTKSIDTLKANAANLPNDSKKNEDVPVVGHKLHRLTVLTSKTPQFHLLAHGNPKPDNLLVSPLAQFELNGNAKTALADAATVGAGDRE